MILIEINKELHLCKAIEISEYYYEDDAMKIE